MQKLLTIVLFSLAISSTFAQFDFETCFQNVGRFANEAEQFVVEIKTHKMNVHKFLNETAQMINQMSSTLSACNIKVPEFIPNKVSNATECFKDIEVLVQEVETVVELVKEKKYLQVIKQIQPLMTDIQNAENDCKLSKQRMLLMAIHPIQCLKEAYKFTKDMKLLEGFIESKNVNQTISETAVILQEIPPTLLDCGQQKLYDELKFLLNIDFVHCGQDLTVLYNLATAVYNDYKASDFTKLVTDGKAFYEQVVTLSNDCKKKAMLLQAPVEGKFTFKCFSKVFALAKESGILVEDIIQKKYDVDTLVKQLQLILNDAQPVCDACGFDVKIPTFDLTEVEKCFNDIANGVGELAELVSDAKRRDFVNVVKEAQNIINSISSSITDCKAI